MYIVTVVFSVYRSKVKEFSLLVAKQAADSLEKEKECLTFDVSIGDGTDEIVPFFLYEIYVNKESFETHIAMNHFHDFSQNIDGMVANKEINVWHKLG